MYWKCFTYQQVKKNVFSGFSGFGARTTPASNAFNISFGAKPPSDNLNSEFNKTPSTNDSETNEKEYLASLKVLNETVTSWIADHVKKNPCCVLTPIFQDYEKHLKDLELKRKSPTLKENKVLDTPKATPASSNLASKADERPTFGLPTVDTPRPSLNFFVSDSTPSKPPTLSFGSSTPAAPPSTFSFKGASSSTATSPSSAPSLFSFTATKPVTTTPMASSFSFGFG